MKTQISLLLFTITIMISLHTDAAVSQHKDQSLIETTCKNTPNYKLCTATIRATPGSDAADLPELGLMVVAAVEKKSKEALSLISKLSRSGEHKLLPALKECTQVYKAVVEGDIPVARQATRGNPKFAETAMADAAVEAEICEGGFKDVGAKSPLSGVNQAVGDLAAVARAIIRNLL